MPVIDMGNNFKVAAQKKVKELKKKVSRETLTNTGKNAGKITPINKLTFEECIAQSLKRVNEAIEEGEFYAMLRVDDKFLEKVCAYYSKKGYIVVKKTSTKPPVKKKTKYSSYYGSENVIISWMGCKNWIKSMELGKLKIDEVALEVYNAIKDLILDEWDETTPYTFYSKNLTRNQFIDNPDLAIKGITEIIKKL